MIYPEIVAVVGSDGSIGKDGDLIRHLPEDLRHFKALTMGGTVVMGRKTWESLPKKPLPGRLNIVMTRNGEYKAEGAKVAGSLESAIALAEQQAPDARLFVIGGGEIYRQSLPMARVLHLTLIDEACPEADTFFPEIDTGIWEETESVPGEMGPYRFATFRHR